MKKSQRKNVYVAGGLVGFSIIMSVMFIGGGLGTGLGDLNTAQLSFVEQSRNISCEAYNEILEDGRVVASGRDGFNPLVDTSTLSLQSSRGDVDSIGIRLVLLCDGDFMDDSSSTTVSGQFQMLLCGDPQNGGTKCIASNDRLFTQLNGVASSTTSTAQVPISPKEIRADVRETVYEGNLSSAFLESLFPEGSGGIVITSKMYPQFTFQFNHPSGVIRATQDSFATNDQVYAQYNGLTNNAPPPPDTDGDGITDNVDSCTGQAEDFNGFEDADGCPDAFKLVDTDGDGVTDVLDACPNQQGLASFQGCPEVDTDGDGLVDSEDECPLIAEPPETSNDGCPVVAEDPVPNPQVDDTDGDGVVDADDICPTTSSGATVDANGCELITDDIVVVNPVNQDADNDGIIDSVDECPNEVGDILNDGCPVEVVVVEPNALDSDGDTIPDSQDACENERGTVRNNGCPENVVEEQQTNIFDDIFNQPASNTPDEPQLPQTTTDRSGTQTGSIIEGFDDFTVFVIFSMIGILAVVGIIVGTGKAKL